MVFPAVIVIITWISLPMDVRKKLAKTKRLSVQDVSFHKNTRHTHSKQEQKKRFHKIFFLALKSIVLIPEKIKQKNILYFLDASQPCPKARLWHHTLSVPEAAQHCTGTQFANNWLCSKRRWWYFGASANTNTLTAENCLLVVWENCHRLSLVSCFHFTSPKKKNRRKRDSFGFADGFMFSVRSDGTETIHQNIKQITFKGENRDALPALPVYLTNLHSCSLHIPYIFDSFNQ